MPYLNDRRWFIEAEAYHAYWYAHNTGRRWLDREPIIARSPQWSYRYARDIIRGRFHLGEPVIVTDAEWAFYYARDILEARWPEAEPVILPSRFFAMYDFLISNDWRFATRDLFDYMNYLRAEPDEFFRTVKPKPEIKTKVNWSKEGF